jgi:diketogulonate reductase-like aldo/keto reductase
VIHRSRRTAALKYADLLPGDAYPVDERSQVVYNSIKVGYRLFDGAGDYGNEKEAGEGVGRALREGIVKREELCG